MGETQREPHRTMDDQAEPERELPTGDEGEDAQPAEAPDESAPQPEQGE